MALESMQDVFSTYKGPEGFLAHLNLTGTPVYHIVTPAMLPQVQTWALKTRYLHKKLTALREHLATLIGLAGVPMKEGLQPYEKKSPESRRKFYEKGR